MIFPISYLYPKSPSLPFPPSLSPWNPPNIQTTQQSKSPMCPTDLTHNLVPQNPLAKRTLDSSPSPVLFTAPPTTTTGLATQPLVPNPASAISSCFAAPLCLVCRIVRALRRCLRMPKPKITNRPVNKEPQRKPSMTLLRRPSLRHAGVGGLR